MSTNIVLSKIRKKMNEDAITEGKLGTTIKYKRKERNQTLQTLSEIVGISVSYISKVENNIISPNISTIKGVLETLEINEKIIESSLIMDNWYLKTICHILDIKYLKEELVKYIEERNDFQARLMKFVLMVNEGIFTKASDELSLLMYSINQMSDLEFIMFLLALVQYHLNDNDYINASLIMFEIKDKYLLNTYINHWYYKLKFKIALMQEDYYKLNKAKDNYINYLFLHNKITLIKGLRNEYINSLSYFLKPTQFENIIDKDYERSKRISLVLNDEVANFKKDKDDLALLLYYDNSNNEEQVLKLINKVDFTNSLFETTLKEYFQIKYFDSNNYFHFLKEQIFSTDPITQHYYGVRFFAGKLKEILLKQFKYKEINLINDILDKSKVIV